MDRSAAQNYLQSEFAELMADAKITSLSSSIDNALRELGYDESALATAVVDNIKRMDYIALLEYFALKRLVRALAPRVDKQMKDQQARKSQAFGQAKALLEDAELRVRELGYLTDAFQSGRFSLDFLAADPCGEF